MSTVAPVLPNIPDSILNPLIAITASGTAEHVLPYPNVHLRAGVRTFVIDMDPNSRGARRAGTFNYVELSAYQHFKCWTITQQMRSGRGAITAIDIYGNRVVVGRFDFGAQGLDRGLVNAAFSQCDLAVFLHPVVATLDALPESTPNGVIYDLRGEEIGRLPLRGVIGPTIGP